jgi:hypothetical protein
VQVGAQVRKASFGFSRQVTGGYGSFLGIVMVLRALHSMRNELHRNEQLRSLEAKVVPDR